MPFNVLKRVGAGLKRIDRIPITNLVRKERVLIQGRWQSRWRDRQTGRFISSGSAQRRIGLYMHNNRVYRTMLGQDIHNFRDAQKVVMSTLERVQDMSWIQREDAWTDLFSP